MVAKAAFMAAGRYGSHAGAENYDLALRVLDQAGETAIGHLDQMLAHLPRTSSRAMQPEAEKQALVDHLARRGLDAEVRDGLLFGTRHMIRCRIFVVPVGRLSVRRKKGPLPAVVKCVSGTSS